MYYTRFDTRFCEMIIVGDEEGVTNLHMNTGEGSRTFEIDSKWVENSDFFREEIEEIEAYMAGEIDYFTVKLNPQGTEYQKKVWKALRAIPYGETCTYKDIAVAIGNPNASRAVGSANGKNPIPLIVPCHRVIGTNGRLTGFAHGVAVKEQMINHETMVVIYNRLLAAYGKQHWWPANHVFEIMVGAILTQNTNWKNVDLALKNFEGQLCPKFIEQIPIEELQELIRPSGFFTQKAARLKAMTKWYKGYDYDINTARKEPLEKVRKELLAINGIGGETADCIVLYTLEKPSFVIDAYTRRVFERIGYRVPKDYEGFKEMIEKAIPTDTQYYNEYHALIVKHAQEYCLKVPKCNGCPLESLCKKKIG